MTDNPPEDPTKNVRDILEAAIARIDDLRKAEVNRIDEKIELIDIKVQTQFTSAKEAVNTAFEAQEKAIGAALVGTREAINKSDATTDKRFDLLSEKIDGIAETISKNTGAQGIYVTHSDLSIEMEKLRTSFESMLRPVINFMNSSQGQQKGVSSSWGVLLGAVGLISTIIGIFMIMSRFLP